MRRQVDPPGQGSCAHQHLDVTSGEHALHQAAVRAQHARVVDPEALGVHLLHLLVPGALDLNTSESKSESKGESESESADSTRRQEKLRKCRF